MDKNLPEMYREYGMYVNSSRAFPNDKDFSKPVISRLLLTGNLLTKEKFLKSATIVGHSLGHFHPHGDQSAYQTLVQLVNNGFFDGQGNFGSNCGVEETPAASMRYTECKLNKEIRKMIFDLIEYIPEVESELDPEPEFLPTMYPICLIGNEYTVGIGFGFRTMIPCFKIQDLKKRLLFLLGQGEKATIKPISDCDILSTNSEIEHLLKTGKGEIRVKGKYKIDPPHNRIYIYSWPYGKSFEKAILAKMQDEFDNGGIGYTDLSTTTTNICIEVLKQRNKDEIFKRICEKIDKVLLGSVSFEMIVVGKYDKKVKIMSVDDMLLSCYKSFEEVNKKMLESEIENLMYQIKEYKVLEKIKPYLSKYLNMKKSSYDEVIQAIAEETKLNNKLIESLFGKYRISKLLTINTESSEIEMHIDTLKKNLENLGDYTISKY
jgi:DNA gyrase subunit A